MKERKKYRLPLTYLINGILVQSFVQIFLIALSHDGLFPEFSYSNKWIAIALIVNMFVFILVLLNIQKLREAENQDIVIEQQKENLDNMGKLVETILQQKHDFANHLQVISGFSQLNRFDELKKYAKEITSEIKPQFQLVALDRIELKSLLFVKAGEAKEKGIAFDFDIKDDFEAFPLCQINAVNMLGNLINNAFAASLDSPSPAVSINLSKEEKHYIIKVRNNGKTIPPYVGDAIFIKGYSTRKGGGLGLYIVKGLVDKYNGQVKYISNPEFGTEFIVKIPEKGA